MSTAAKAAAQTIIKNVLVARTDDWTALYVNGNKITEGHSLSEDEILQALGIVFDQVWIDPEWAEDNGFPATTTQLPY